MRRPINWFVFALSLGFLVLGHRMQPRPAVPVVIEPARLEPARLEPVVATAMPAAYRPSRANLDFGYIERER